jgi:hypothetical protein
MDQTLGIFNWVHAINLECSQICANAALRHHLWFISSKKILFRIGNSSTDVSHQKDARNMLCVSIWKVAYKIGGDIIHELGAKH